MEANIPVRGKDYFFAFLYEAIGSCILVASINLSKGDAWAIAFALFVAIIIVAKISGGHCDPAVTVGVYIGLKGTQGKYCCMFFTIMMGHTFGAFLGVALGWSYRGDEGILSLAMDDPGREFLRELWVSFIFFLTIYVYQSEYLGPSSDLTLIAAGVSLTLGAMLKCGGHTLNPAFGLAQSVFKYGLTGDKNEIKDLWIWIIAPNLGAILAQIYNRCVHEPAYLRFHPELKKEEEVPTAGEKNDKSNRSVSAEGEAAEK